MGRSRLGGQTTFTNMLNAKHTTLPATVWPRALAVERMTRSQLGVSLPCDLQHCPRITTEKPQ